MAKIYEDFQRLRMEYQYDTLKGSGDPGEKERLMYFSDEFTMLYGLIRPHCSIVYGLRTKHDDKACSAFKARIARNLQAKEPKLSWNKATEFAAATEEYKEFLEQRIVHYQNWDSISHLKDSIKQYVINIGMRVNNL